MQICLAGEGHGAIAAFRSLTNQFGKTFVYSDTAELLASPLPKPISSLDKLSNAVVVCAGYKKIIPDSVLLNNTFVNTHPSLLPRYRGLHPLVWSMLSLEKEVGFSIHIMTKEIDAGPILRQYKTLTLNKNIRRNNAGV